LRSSEVWTRANDPKLSGIDEKRGSPGDTIALESPSVPNVADRKRHVIRRTVALTMAWGFVGLGLLNLHPAIAQDTSVSVETGIVYATRAGTDLRMDAYLPSAAGEHPAVLVIVDPGQEDGDKIDSTRLPVDLANRGFASFAVPHRSLADSKFPAPLEDLQSAVRYIRDHADRFGVDP
jgi:hypothetical protein